MSEEQIATYLRTPPLGFDAQVWRQVFERRNDGSVVLPLAIRGFDELKQRQQLQLEEHHTQKMALSVLNKRLDGAQNTLTTNISRAHMISAEHGRLQHRLTRVICSLHSKSKISSPLASDEEQLLARLEAINVHLNAPDQIKSHVTEAISIIRCQYTDDQLMKKEEVKTPRPSIHSNRLIEFQRYLARCQSGLETLVETVKLSKADVDVLATQLTQ